MPGPVIAVPVRAAESRTRAAQESRLANIEGGEYDLIPALDGSSFLPRIKRLFIQFHSISETSTQDRRRCQEILFADAHMRLGLSVRLGILVSRKP